MERVHAIGLNNLLAVIVVAVGGVMCASSVAEGAYSGVNGRVAFVRTISQPCYSASCEPCSRPECAVDSALLTVAADGRNGRRIDQCTDAATPFLAPCLQGPPDYSPDGARLAYASHGQIVIADADGGHPRVLPGPADLMAHDPRWAPNGRTLAFTASGQATGGSDIYLARADGSATRQLTTNHRASNATWSSRLGLTFVQAYPRPHYIDRRPVYTRFLSIDTRSGAVRRVMTHGFTPLDRNIWDPEWAPDGRRVLFSGTQEFGTGRRLRFVNSLYVLDVVNHRLRRVYRIPRDQSVGGTTWSPDGSRIAFVLEEAILAIPSRGGPTHTLWRASTTLPADHEVSISRPSWQPLARR